MAKHAYQSSSSDHDSDNDRVGTRTTSSTNKRAKTNDNRRSRSSLPSSSPPPQGHQGDDSDDEDQGTDAARGDRHDQRNADESEEEDDEVDMISDDEDHRRDMEATARGKKKTLAAGVRSAALVNLIQPCQKHPSYPFFRHKIGYSLSSFFLILGSGRSRSGEEGRSEQLHVVSGPPITVFTTNPSQHKLTETIFFSM